MFGLIAAAAMLLAVAGQAKLPRRAAGRSGRLGPNALRVVGAGEVAVAIIALWAGGRFAGALIAAAFGALALVSARMISVARGQDCGCFAKPTPISHWHTAVNLAFAIVGLVAVAQPANGLVRQVSEQPATSVVLLIGAGTLACLGYLAMTALPELLSLATPVEVA